MSHVDKLKDLVYAQKRTVSIRDICYSLDVHISEARRILDEFVAEENKKGDPKLIVNYIVGGSGLDSTEDYKVHKLTYAKAEELDEVKKGFKTVNSCKVNSISLKDEETINPGDDVKETLLDRDVLLKKQKLTYIVNDDIHLRPDRLERLKLISGVEVNSGTNNDVKCEVKKEKKEKENKMETKKETKTSNKRTTNRRNTSNKKQSKLSGFGSVVPKSEKTNSSRDSGLSMESTPDPFSEEDEEEDSEEKSPEREATDEEMEVDKCPESPQSSSEMKAESEEDEKPKRKADNSEDEAIFMEEVKKKSKRDNKKRKRVKIYDSDEEDEDTIAARILAGEDDSNHSNQSAARSSIESVNIKEEPEKEEEEEEEKPVKKPRKRSKPMETKIVTEEFIDEEGYTQVRSVKKLVPVKEEEEEEEETKGKNPKSSENGNDKKEANGKSKKEKTDKPPASKKQKTEEDDQDEEAKPKTKKLSKAAQAKKGQVSITSFFKPAAKV